MAVRDRAVVRGRGRARAFVDRVSGYFILSFPQCFSNSMHVSDEVPGFLSW
jgi:hypothetical protein